MGSAWSWIWPVHGCGVEITSSIDSDPSSSFMASSFALSPHNSATKAGGNETSRGEKTAQKHSGGIGYLWHGFHAITSRIVGKEKVASCGVCDRVLRHVVLHDHSLVSVLFVIRMPWKRRGGTHRGAPRPSPQTFDIYIQPCCATLSRHPLLI